MQSRPNGLYWELARNRDLLITEASDFPQQKYVTVSLGQSSDCAAERDGQLLRRRNSWRIEGNAWWTPSSIPQVIQGEVPCDSKQPRALSQGVGLRHPCPSDSQKHFLRQIASGLRCTHDSTQVSEHAVVMLGAKTLDLGHA